MSWNRITEDNEQRITEDGQDRITESTALASCEILGAVVDYDGVTIRPGKRLYVYQATNGSIFDKRAQVYTLLSNGSWSPRLIFERLSTIYVFMESPRFDTNKYVGRAITLPDAVSIALGDLGATVETQSRFTEDGEQRITEDGEERIE